MMVTVLTSNLNRAGPSEFVIPLAKYYKATYSSQISLGMRFHMMFETEESGTRRYMGTITGINDLDPVRWKNSQWRNLQVEEVDWLISSFFFASGIYSSDALTILVRLVGMSRLLGRGSIESLFGRLNQ